MYTCSVIGATGYTGSELIRILATHPRVKIAHLTTRSDEKINARTLVPTLGKQSHYVIEKKDMRRVARESDVLFVALPHTSAMEVVPSFLAAGKIVIDLSADFRLKSPKVFEAWYHARHRQPSLLRKAVYGLPEMFRPEIQKADLIANPGCYPTSVILGLYPLVKEKLIVLDSIIIDSKSGTSGAGKKLSQALHFPETNENFNAYKVNEHQHMPEIEQVLNGAAAGAKVSFTFVPHLLPLTRGILSTTYAEKCPGVSSSRIVRAFESCYGEEPFTRFRGEGVFPSLRDVQHTNFCDIGVKIDPRTGRVIVISVIDNLIKGASGQAVQNMNIRLGFSEETALLW